MWDVRTSELRAAAARRGGSRPTGTKSAALAVVLVVMLIGVEVVVLHY